MTNETKEENLQPNTAAPEQDLDHLMQVRL